MPGMLGACPGGRQEMGMAWSAEGASGAAFTSSGRSPPLQQSSSRSVPWGP